MQKPKYKILTDVLLPDLETKMNEAAENGYSLKGEIQKQNTIYLAVMTFSETDQKIDAIIEDIRNWIYSQQPGYRG